MNNSSFLKTIRDNWMLIAFIGGIIIGWTDIQDRIRQNELVIQNQQTEIAALTVKIEANQADVAGIAGDIKAIKVSLNFIETRFK